MGAGEPVLQNVNVERVVVDVDVDDDGDGNFVDGEGSQ